jgi:hypothetical protein
VRGFGVALDRRDGALNVLDIPALAKRRFPRSQTEGLGMLVCGPAVARSRGIRFVEGVGRVCANRRNYASLSEGVFSGGINLLLRGIHPPLPRNGSRDCGTTDWHSQTLSLGTRPSGFVKPQLGTRRETINASHPIGMKACSQGLSSRVSGRPPLDTAPRTVDPGRGRSAAWPQR